PVYLHSHIPAVLFVRILGRILRGANRSERGGGLSGQGTQRPDVACRTTSSANQEHLGIGERPVLRVETCMYGRHLALRVESGLAEPSAAEGEHGDPAAAHSGVA